MAVYLTNTNELTSIADAIRAKKGTSADLTYPQDFISAITSIANVSAAAWETIFDQDVTIVSDSPNYFVYSPYSEQFVGDATYKVTWGTGGTQYICSPVPDETGQSVAYDGYFIGNAAVAGNTPDTGEPFIIYRRTATQLVGVTQQSAGTIHVKIERLSAALAEKVVTVNGTYEAADDNIDGYSIVTVNVPSSGGMTVTSEANTTGTTAVITSSSSGGGGTPSVTQHTVYLEFSDSTNTTIPVYYDDSFIGTMIVNYKPDTYNNKTINTATLDSTTWYDRFSIPLNTQLIDYTKVTADYSLTSDGELETAQWYGATDYTEIDPTMTFSIKCNMWGWVCVYDSSKTFINSFSPHSEGFATDPNDSNVAVGTIGGNGWAIPSNTVYVRFTTLAHPDDTICSLIRTA